MQTILNWLIGRANKRAVSRELANFATIEKTRAAMFQNNTARNGACRGFGGMEVMDMRRVRRCNEDLADGTYRY